MTTEAKNKQSEKQVTVEVKQAIGHSVQISLSRDAGPSGSWVHIDGYPIHGINRLEIIASSDWANRPQLVLYLSPEHMSIEGHDVDLNSILDLKSPAERFEVDLD
jgi:hypothetical protein